MKKSTLLIIFILIAFSLASCNNNDEEELVASVRAYNGALVQVYYYLDLERLEPYASSEQINRVFPVVLALQNSRSRMVATQTGFSIKYVRNDGDVAEVQTLEKWDYWWEDISTKMVTKPETQQEYALIYHLKKSASTWLIDNIETLD